MNPKVEQQVDAEIRLCGAISNLIREHGYSVYDVRFAVGAFTGEVLSGLQQRDPEAAARLAKPRFSTPDNAKSLETRWASHSRGFLVDA